MSSGVPLRFRIRTRTIRRNMMNKQEHQAPRQQAEEVNAGVVLPRRIHLVPLDYIDGYAVRPGFY